MRKSSITTYSTQMKMADLITHSDQLSILQRFNIRLGFGESTVEEICKRYDTSPSLFITIFNIHSFDSYTPDIENLTKHDVQKIVTYLQKTHEDWFTQCFPRLHANIHRMLESCDPVNQKILNDFFDNYDVEFQKHLEYEEKTVFPYILSLDKQSATKKFRIKDFKKNHGNIEEKLADLKSIVIKYLPEIYSSVARIDVLNDIFKIQNDLAKHTLIENKLLIPLVSKLEIE